MSRKQVIPVILTLLTINRLTAPGVNPCLERPHSHTSPIKRHLNCPGCIMVGNCYDVMWAGNRLRSLQMHRENNSWPSRDTGRWMGIDTRRSQRGQCEMAAADLLLTLPRVGSCV